MRRRQMVQMQSVQAMPVNAVPTQTYQPMKGQGLGQMSPAKLPSAPLLKKRGWPKGVKRKSKGASYS